MPSPTLNRVKVYSKGIMMCKSAKMLISENYLTFVFSMNDLSWKKINVIVFVTVKSIQT